MPLRFATILWTAIVAIDVAIVAARPFLPRGPLRLGMALAVPGFIILGAAVNAIYNWLTSGHPLEAPQRPRAARR
jgi:hypothetical protein